MCDLYLGDTHSRATTPPTPFWTNPSVQCFTYTFTAGTTYPINVVLQNHDLNTGCMGALVDLYWADPTTSFLLVGGAGGNQIPSSGTPVQPITFATVPVDASATFSFSWTPTLTIAGTNGGHVCLAAIASCTTPDCVAPAPCGPGMTATTSSPQVAIHNVQVNAPPMPMHRGPHRWGIRPFFFGATNGGKNGGLTRLVARAYNPADEADRVHLLRLAALPSVRQAYGPCFKFGTPAEVLLALGAESIVVPTSTGGGFAPRLGFTGAVDAEVGEELVKRNWARVAAHHSVVKEVDLLPRQVHQAAVHVVPADDDGRVYAIEIGHEMPVKNGPPVILGGLTVLFASPHRPW
jgi:hypothetical protein